jgi:shikimate kinase
MNRYVVVSGFPTSGKSTLARALSQALSLALLDKDYFLEAHFDSKGIGDAQWRRQWCIRESCPRMWTV